MFCVKCFSYIFICFVISYLLPSLFFSHKLHILVTIHGYILDITKTILSEKEKRKNKYLYRREWRRRDTKIKKT